jgi:hypothetical protein
LFLICVVIVNNRVWKSPFNGLLLMSWSSDRSSLIFNKDYTLWMRSDFALTACSTRSTAYCFLLLRYSRSREYRLLSFFNLVQSREVGFHSLYDLFLLVLTLRTFLGLSILRLYWGLHALLLAIHTLVDSILFVLTLTTILIMVILTVIRPLFYQKELLLISNIIFLVLTIIIIVLLIALLFLVDECWFCNFLVIIIAFTILIFLLCRHFPIIWLRVKSVKGI